MHRLDDSQGRQLVAIMLATRPDWAPKNPGAMLEAANRSGFMHAADYGHMIRALAHYATQPDAHGNPFGRSPDGYTRAGTHWTTTAPQGYETPPPELCKKHPPYYAHNCGGCRFEHLQASAVAGAFPLEDGNA